MKIKNMKILLFKYVQEILLPEGYRSQLDEEVALYYFRIVVLRTDHYSWNLASIDSCLFSLQYEEKEVSIIRRINMSVERSLVCFQQVVDSVSWFNSPPYHPSSQESTLAPLHIASLNQNNSKYPNSLHSPSEDVRPAIVGGDASILDIFQALDTAATVDFGNNQSRHYNTLATTLSSHQQYPISSVSRSMELKCHKCNGVYASHTALSRHSCTAGIVKHLKCPWPYCTYSTFRNDHLKIHVRKHTGERPYRCPHCEYRCNQKSQLNGHVAKKHMTPSND